MTPGQEANGDYLGTPFFFFYTIMVHSVYSLYHSKVSYKILSLFHLIQDTFVFSFLFMLI